MQEFFQLPVFGVLRWKENRTAPPGLLSGGVLSGRRETCC